MAAAIGPERARARRRLWVWRDHAGVRTARARRRCARSRPVDGDARASPGSVPRNRGSHNATFEHADAQVHPLDAHRFDLVVSRFGAMFFGDPVAAFGTSLAGWHPTAGWRSWSGSSFVATSGSPPCARRSRSGARSPSRRSVQPGPFGLADPDAAHSILETAGFASVSFAGIEAPFRLGADADDAFVFVEEHRTGARAARGTRCRRHRASARRTARDRRRHDTVDGVFFGSAGVDHPRGRSP